VIRGPRGSRGLVRAAILATVIALSGLMLANPAPAQATHARSDRERLIGAWHLVALNQAGPGDVANLEGTLIYTRDGHMSVQIMYPNAQSDLSNDYVLHGYEASFGSYDVNEAAHTITHHVRGSITRGLVGKNLTRVYQFTADGHLVIRSALPTEHWSVEWQHD
jgi:hypothetical protein